MNRSERRLSAPHVRTRQVIDPSRVSGTNTGLNAHRMVAETAVRLANEYYEPYMSANNALYKSFREHFTDKESRTIFVSQAAPQLLEEARVALTDCLTQPDHVVSKRLKDEIADALIKDTDFRANRLKAAEHMPHGLLN
jgi:hypothetical protein